MSEEEAMWASKDPLVRLETYLRDNNLVDDAFFEQLSADADAMAAKVREDAMAFPVPPLAKSFEQVYAEAHPLIQEELAWHLEYEAGFADAAEGEH